MENDETIQLMASMLSEQGGQLSALHAGLTAVLMHMRTQPEISRALHFHLEQAYARHLGESMNPVFLEGFEQMAELLRASLTPPQDG